MKIARRLLSVLLALLMIFALAACTGNGGNTDTNKPSTGGSTGDGFVMPDRPTDETDGKEYIIIQHAEDVNPFGYAQDSNMGLQIADRVTEVEEMYGCDITFTQMAYDTTFATQLQALQYSENSGDLIFAEKNAMLRQALGTGGETSLMQDLLQVDHIINFWDANKWGTITARESMMAGGTFYGVSPALWVDCTPLPYYQVVYNKDIVEAAGVTDPQEYWEKKEWDRDAMLDVIIGTTDEASGIWGMTATDYHMVRASFLATGKTMVVVDSINADGTVEWSNGLESGEAMEALQWLKNTLKSNAKCFNNGKSTWSSEGAWLCSEPFNEGLSAMVVTRAITLFDSIVVDGPDHFGLITWAGEEANILTGYYEQVYSVAIPLFAQNIEHSAFLMADLFEGLGEVETYNDVIAYYGKTYFDTDIDLECLVREGAVLQYSYWPNDNVDAIWNQLGANLMSSSSVSSLINKYVGTIETAVETHIVPNTVALQEFKEQGKFD